jgi:hypothetical protein
MLTGAYHPRPNATTAANIRPSPSDRPHLGSLLARVRPGRGGVPVFASLPEVIKDAGVNEFPGQGPGFLGQRYGPFRVEADDSRTGFRLPEVVLPPGTGPGRLEDRRRLLARLDRAIRVGEGRLGADRDGFYERAFSLLASPAVKRAFELEQEPGSLRARYGGHLFGQGCLLARRLLEAGLALVTVYWHYEGPDDSPVWDTHQNNFAHLRARLLPPFDQAFAALLEDLHARGLLDETLVVCLGEFGRTPKINKHAGRDHWAAVQSVVLAGAGVRPGSVYGSSDRLGAYPADARGRPPDLAATILHLLGVNPKGEVHDQLGRPFPVCEGTPVRGLLA